MISYIKWLAERAYNYAVSAINGLNAWIQWFKNRIIEAANWAIERAKDFARYLYQLLQLGIELAKIVLYNYILYYFGKALDWIEQKTYPLRRAIQDTIALIGQRIREAFEGFIRPIWDRIQPVIDWFNRLWRSIQDVINWVINEGIHLPGRIADLWNLLRHDVIPAISNFVQNAIPTLNTVVSNPWGFIFPYLKQYLWELLQFILAYEMGTVKASLPPWPTFNFTGAGGAMSYADSSEIDNSGLHSPLDSLYISGYRFGPGHPGLDLGLSNGTPIYAMHDGVVELAAYGSTGYAVQVVIRGDKWWSRYAHCQELLVRKDDPVRGGQIIALGNSTGNSTGPHLHLEVKYNNQFVDPVSVLPI